jgi:CheY-like chemotaxis protein
MPPPKRADESRRLGFQSLMPRRIRKILLAASPYDSFILEQDGQISDLILTELLDPNLRNIPTMVSVSSGEEALEAVRRSRFDLVITTTHLGDMPHGELARRMRKAGSRTPIVLLAIEHREPPEALARQASPDIERVFVWQGDRRILLGILGHLEDRWNVRHDSGGAGVSSIILIEDNPRYYSSFLPMLYAELMKQSRSVISEGTNLTSKLMRMRARPKILLCTTFEEAEQTYARYRRTILGILSDVDFPREGRMDPRAGVELARRVRAADPELPIMLHTLDPHVLAGADAGLADVVLKDSPTLLHEVSRFMTDRFGFGDFVFRSPDGVELGRAPSLHALEALLHTVPDESLLWHAARNHFSTWLRARAEFGLAEELRPRRVSDFRSVVEIRSYLTGTIREFRRERQSGLLSDFDAARFETATSFARIGGGSLGGKARGLAFIRQLLYKHRLRRRFPGVEIFVPSAVVLATDVFDQFLEHNDLRDFALHEESNEAIEKRFIEARFPEAIFEDLMRYLDLVDHPLAVRSSSLLEDSPTLPFAGVYRTYMVPNSHPDRAVRVKELVHAIKRVYASTFFREAKAYMRTTPHRLEEEKMAVIVQRLLGVRHGARFYPDFAGSARSYNFYPSPPMRAEDGIACVALGLGRTVEEGGRAVRFCPRFPRHPVHASSPTEVAENAQTEFYALELEPPGSRPDPTAVLELRRHGLDAAREDGTLEALASTYSVENDAVYDGSSREGIPLVTFAPVLKQELFPLPGILELLLDIGRRGLNMPAEIEFAVNLSVSRGEPAEFAFLQMRPFLVPTGLEPIAVDEMPRERLVCFSRSVLGHGRIDGIRDVVVVDRDRFERPRSAEIAVQIARQNALLAAEGRPYILIGVGRWGASDPWLGIPVTWDQIAAARVIVECGFRDLPVVPSQGSHFFQNLASFQVGYFTVEPGRGGFVDWEWLADRPAAEETPFVRRLRLERPLTVSMDGHRGGGVIVKPEG